MKEKNENIDNQYKLFRQEKLIEIKENCQYH
mgnify:CR=1 FL=1